MRTSLAVMTPRARSLVVGAAILDGGRVVADGPTAELLDAPDLLRAHGLEMS